MNLFVCKMGTKYLATGFTGRMNRAKTHQGLNVMLGTRQPQQWWLWSPFAPGDWLGGHSREGGAPEMVRFRPPFKWQNTRPARATM